MKIHYKLDRLRAVITGGTKGIGLSIADSLQASGAEVIITGTKDQTITTDKFKYYKVDFLNDKQLNSFRKELEKIKPDILINNAGINIISHCEDVTSSEFNKIQKINLHAPFYLSQSALAGMKEKKWGRIINISSIWGQFSKPGRCAYTISKFALNGLTKNLAIEVAPYNILVNSVAPGFIDTTLTRKTLSQIDIKKISNQIPLARLGKPSEIANLVTWLVSRENTYLTGQVIAIDGGFTST